MPLRCCATGLGVWRAEWVFRRIAEDRGIEPQEQIKRLTDADNIYARRVQRMLDLHQQQQAANGKAARERLQREIKVTDEKIDQLVYELYGLTKEEIKIVEGRSSPYADSSRPAPSSKLLSNNNTIQCNGSNFQIKGSIILLLRCSVKRVGIE
jgi:hypothetical protein